MSTQHYDFVVIGSGPAGQKSAIQAAKQGKKVALIERGRELGGSCVHRGTIPSKTLRENALRVKNMRQNAKLAHFSLQEDTELATLIDRLAHVLSEHDNYMKKQLQRNSVEVIHGRARFKDSNTIEISRVQKEQIIVHAEKIVIASGSLPRTPENIPIDHENLFDSDSFLSMMYIPKSLIVLGGGVIASEYATIFQALGTKVTMIDKYPRPLGFLDDDLTENFISEFQAMGGVWRGNSQLKNCQWNGIDAVEVTLADGNVVKSEKLLCAAGRMANVKELDIENTGLALNERGLISVDEDLRTSVSHIFAAGDVIGPPSLASASMEQGRRASCNAMDIDAGNTSSLIPTGIYSIPELSSVGLSESQARQQHEHILVGKAKFEEVARGQISGITNGMLKIVSDAKGQRILGVMIVGEGATELIHIGQMAILSKLNVCTFVETTFNFPTLAEAYRVAALDIIGQLS